MKPLVVLGIVALAYALAIFVAAKGGGRSTPWPKIP